MFYLLRFSHFRVGGGSFKSHSMLCVLSAKQVDIGLKLISSRPNVYACKKINRNIIITILATFTSMLLLWAHLDLRHHAKKTQTKQICILPFEHKCNRNERHLRLNCWSAFLSNKICSQFIQWIRGSTSCSSHIIFILDQPFSF